MQPSAPTTIEYELNESDILALTQHWLRESTEQRRSRRLIAIGLILGAMVLSLIITTQDWNASLFILAATAAWLGVMLIWSRHTMARRAVQKHFRDGHGRVDLGSYRLTVTSTSIELATQLKQSSLSFGGVWKLEETENHLFVYTTPVNAIIVPRRVFQAPGECRTFADLIKQGLNQATIYHLYCPACGYDLRQIQVVACPECGWRRQGENE